MISLTTIAILVGVILDFILGDPNYAFHPICLIGRAISFFEKKYRALCPRTPRGERRCGALLLITILILSTSIPACILLLAYKIHPVVYAIVASIFCYQLMATKSLKDESMKVYAPLKEHNLEKGRYAVSMIVGRDTSKLDEAGITRATVETIAENASDGCIAPLFYMLIGGPILGFAYKAINTLDSMVGYKNEKYVNVGRYSAKLDDIVNFIPSRLAALFMIVASFLLGMRGKQACKVFIRDRKKSPSPNSAQTESVMAGALGVWLLGDTWYFGKLHKKESIGDHQREIESEDIKRANQLLYMTVILFAIVGLIVRFIVV